MIVVQVLAEGLLLSALMILTCVICIRNGTVNMVYFYSSHVQKRCAELGMTTHEKIKRDHIAYIAICVPIYIIYVLVCVYAINGARGFWPGFWQILVIMSVVNLVDRFFIDEYWVNHTDSWIIPGTEDLKPYIGARHKRIKWLVGTVGVALMSALLSGIAALVIG